MAADSGTEKSLKIVEVVGDRPGIASAYAGWLLSCMGADVTRLVPTEAGPTNEDTPITLALEALALGKSSLCIPSDPQEMEALVSDQDILLTESLDTLSSWVPSSEILLQRVPHLVVGVPSIFGLTGPHAETPATALDAQALSSVAWSMGEPGREPLSVPPGILEHQAGAWLASGVLLALEARNPRGNGRVVDVALCDVLASYVAGNCRFYIHHGLEWQRSGRRASGSGGAYPFVNLPCADGEVCLCGRTREEWNRLIVAMGNPAWASEPRYQRLRAMGKEYPEEVDELLLPWFAAHTKVELEAIALEHNLTLAPIRRLDEALETPQFHERGFLVPETVAGSRVRVPSLPFRVARTRSADAEDLAANLLTVTTQPRTVPASPGQPADELPLAGLRVADFGWVWSAPWVSAILAELGAQVIKVEHGKRPDNLRLAGRVIRDGEVVEGPSREMSPMFHQVNHGKLGVTLNLKEPRAVELAKRLIDQCDLVIENMSPGSMDRSGLGYAELSATKPELVMLAMSVAGQHGTLASMRAYAPTMSSFIGLEGLIGYRDEAPIGALNFALSDPSASIHALLPVLAALRRARCTGEGCYIDFSQTEALLGTLRPYLIDAQLHGRQPPVMGNASPDMAPHGIYPAAGEDRWLTLAIGGASAWKALTEVASDQDWTKDPRFGTAKERRRHVSALDDAVAGWTRTWDRDDLVRRLRAVGIASSPVLSIEEMWNDPQVSARRSKHSVEVPSYGALDVFRAPWRFSDCEPEITRCGPATGEHNAFVFGELLGLSHNDIEALVRAEVIS